MTERSFAFEVPAYFFSKAEAPEGRRRRVGGPISVETWDKQDELVLQRGLDLTDFARSGWWNDNHSKETDGIVGFPDPDSFRVFEKGAELPNGKFATSRLTWAEGWMLEGDDRAEKIWSKAQALQKADAGRHLGFSIEGKVEERRGAGNKIIAKARVKNVAITHCFTGDVRVSGLASKVTRRFYSGPMVELRLTSGHKITGTPNHPIFTQRGWVALGALNERNDRIGCFSGHAVSTSNISHDVEDMPPSFQEVFDLACLSNASRWIGLAREAQFHGDRGQGDVDVVLPNGLLRDRLQAAFFQKFGKDALAASDKQLPTLSSASQRSKMLPAAFFTQPGDGGGFRESLSLVGTSARIPELQFFSNSPRDSGIFSEFEDPLARDSVTGRDCGRALSQQISFNDIASVRFFEFTGHVFNLETTHGWYEANGIVAHNCPVNNDTRLEVLAKSLRAIEEGNDELVKMLAMGTPASPGSIPIGPQSGATAGQVLTLEDLEGAPRKKKRKKKKLTKADAIAWYAQMLPNVTDQRLLERLVEAAEAMKRNGSI